MNKVIVGFYISFCWVSPNLRTLNSLLYSISIFQSRFDEEGSKYFQKKLAEGKSKRLARKCLARQVSNQIWKILFAA